MTRTPPPLTPATIRALRADAARAGDLEQVALCDRALAGSVAARGACEAALAAARVMTDDHVAVWLDTTSEPGRSFWIVSLEADGTSDTLRTFPADAVGLARVLDRAALEASARNLVLVVEPEQEPRS